MTTSISYLVLLGVVIFSTLFLFFGLLKIKLI